MKRQSFDTTLVTTLVTTSTNQSSPQETQPLLQKRKPPLQETQVSSVIGLQYGDEGKGQIVDILSEQNDIIVRYNGGANAGHSVAIGNEKYVLHQIPIGTLTPNKQNILANGVVISVEALLTEMQVLQSAGIDLTGLNISSRAHLVMPYHLIEEKLKHEITIKQLGPEATLGTTAKGIGPCYADKASRDTAIRVCDLFEPEQLERRLKFIVIIKNAMLSALAATTEMVYEPLKASDLLSQCNNWAKELKPFVNDTSQRLNDEIKKGSRVLFEGANAALLDVDHGTYPFVTSSNGSTLGISAGSGISPSLVGNKIGVAKTYMSRVGTGPFTTEIDGDVANHLRETGAEFGSTTGRPRRIGWLDLPALEAMVRLNHIDQLVLTGLAVLSTLEEFKVCIAYQLEGTTVRELPVSSTEMAKLVPIYKEINVDAPLSNCASIDNMPPWVIELKETIESSTVEVAALCFGKRRDQILWC